MSEIKTIVVKKDLLCADMAIHAEMKFEVICAVPGLPFGGIFRLKYCPRFVPEEPGVILLEWNSLAEVIQGMRQEKMTAEEFVSRMANKIYEVVEPVYLNAAIDVTSSFHLPVTIEVTL